MNQAPPTPKRPGWYWDPGELEYNVAVRQRWRGQGMYFGSEKFRLRRWDGSAWTADTLSDYVRLQGTTGIPHLVGPDSRLHPLTREESRRRLKRWAVLMLLSCIGVVVFELVK